MSIIFTGLIGGASPTAYADEDDMNDIFGSCNVQKWADLDNDQDTAKITARINRALLATASMINSRLSSCGFTIPLVAEDGAENPYILVDLNASLAGIWLYEHRGIDDFDPKTGRTVHRLIYLKEQAMATLEGMCSGIYDIGAVRSSSAAPEASDGVGNENGRCYWEDGYNLNCDQSEW